MQFKKLALTLTLSAAFGLMACGDDSSSGPSNSDSGSELQKEFQEVQKEMMEGLEKLGKCTEDNAGEEKSVTVKGKDYKVVCEDGEWESDELDDLIEDYEKRIAEENGKHIDGEGCNFKKTDKTWTYSYTRDSYGESISTTITVKINGNEYTEKIKSVTSGQSAAMACSLAPKEMEESGGYCDGDTFVIEETNTDDIDNDEDLQELFDRHMESCQIANGNYDWEPESNKDDEDVDKPSKDEDIDEPDKPAKDEKDDEDDEMTVVCELEESADQWKVLLDYGYGGGTGKTWTWTSETSVTINTFSYTETSSESECEEMLQFTANASCDGTKFIKSVGEEKVEDTSKESMLASAQSTCDMYKTMIED